MPGRLLVYLGLLWLEGRPTDQRGERFQVGAIVVNLTGRGNASRDFEMGPIRTTLGVREVNLAEEDANEVLDLAAENGAYRGLLAWVPLMKGGGEPATIARWVELANREPLRERRSTFALLALTFAQLGDSLGLWRKALEGWNVIKSPLWDEWTEQTKQEAAERGRTEGVAIGEARGRTEGVAIGEARGRAEAIVQALDMRFGAAISADVAEAIRATTDTARLDTLFAAAIRAGSVEDFLTAFRS